MCTLSSPPQIEAFAFSHSLVCWPLNRYTVSTPGNAPGVSRFQGERITFFLDTETRYYLHTPGRVEVLAQKPRTASANTIIAQLGYLCNPGDLRENVAHSSTYTSVPYSLAT